MPAVACANQVSRSFGDTRVVLEDTLRFDSGDNVPGMPSRHGRTTLFTDDFWNVWHICTTAGSNGRASVAAVRSTAGHWFGSDGRGSGACHQRRLKPRAAPRRRFRDELDTSAVSIAVTALRTRINPNVEAGGNLARRIPVAVYIRFAARAAAGMTRSGLL